jgi:hypothetical protein
MIFTIKYAPKSLKIESNGKEITPEGTILKSAETYIGINCGCYGRLHRQVAHITERWEGNGGNNDAH